MIKWRYIVLGIFVLVATELSAQNNLAQAYQHFQEGKYNDALNIYEEAMNSITDDPELYYNAGCTALRMADYGKAILYLEKALRYDSSVEDAQINLAIARHKAGPNYILPQSKGIAHFWQKTKTILNSNQWAVLGLLFVYFLVGFIIYNRKARIKVAKPLLYLLIIFMSISFYFSWEGYSYAQNTNRGVFMDENTLVQLTPDAEAEPIKLVPGQTAELLKKEKDQQPVRLPNGEKVYINQGNLIRI